MSDVQIADICFNKLNRKVSVFNERFDSILSFTKAKDSVIIRCGSQRIRINRKLFSEMIIEMSNLDFGG